MALPCDQKTWLVFCHVIADGNMAVVFVLYICLMRCHSPVTLSAVHAVTSVAQRQPRSVNHHTQQRVIWTFIGSIA